MKVFCCALAMVFSVFSLIAKADGQALIQIENPRIFTPLKGSNATAGYGKIINTSNQEIHLSVVNANAFKVIELHESLEKDGRMKMQRLDEIKIAAKGSFEFKPGGNHIMLFDKTRELKAGDKVLVRFEVNGQPFELGFLITDRVSSEAR